MNIGQCHLPKLSNPDGLYGDAYSISIYLYKFVMCLRSEVNAISPILSIVSYGPQTTQTAASIKIVWVTGQIPDHRYGHALQGYQPDRWREE